LRNILTLNLIDYDLIQKTIVINHILKKIFILSDDFFILIFNAIFKEKWRNWIRFIWQI